VRALILPSLVTVNGWLYHDASCPRMNGRQEAGDGKPPLDALRPVPLSEAATMSPARGCCQPLRIVLVTVFDADGLGPVVGPGIYQSPTFSN
jgi:hypothetical protein